MYCGGLLVISLATLRYKWGAIGVVGVIVVEVVLHCGIVHYQLPL